MYIELRSTLCSQHMSEDTGAAQTLTIVDETSGGGGTFVLWWTPVSWRDEQVELAKWK